MMILRSIADATRSSVVFRVKHANTSFAWGRTSFVIKRSDFGMDKMVGPVGDEGYISIAIESAKK